MFTILAGQRSGTHLLASLLDSHPDIRCYEEVLLRSLAWDNRNNELGEKHPLLMEENEGGIVMYNHFVAADEDTAKKIVENKIIHLTRDTEDRLHSLYGLNNQDKFNTKDFYKEEEEIFVPEPPDWWKEKKRKEFKYMERRALSRVPEDKDIFEISYEELTGGRSIEEIPRKKAAPICEYLGVYPHKLTTFFRKPRYVSNR